jgi:branched-chain amino acid transport system ATP-binding protein
MTSDGLIIQGISKRFGEFEALRNVRAVVPAGTITALIGPNGAGKTTLLHIIGGSLHADQGRLLLGGRRIEGQPPHVLARMGVGRQFQDMRVFDSLTVTDNVMVAVFPRAAQQAWRWMPWVRDREVRAEAERTAAHWLKHVGLTDCSDLRAGALSLGQQRLLALARLLARRPKLLLLDEPTAGLSQEMAQRVVQIIRNAATDDGVTILLVEHDMRIVADTASWIHFMHEGRIAFSGATPHVLGNEHVRRLYMGL